MVFPSKDRQVKPSRPLKPSQAALPPCDGFSRLRSTDCDDCGDWRELNDFLQPKHGRMEPSTVSEKLPYVLMVSMPRFAILEHDYPTRHWDFLLEEGDVLLTWRLSAAPAAGVVTEALQMFDHRRLYLDYEGPVSGDRGCVARRDGGTFEWEEREEDRKVVRLSGLLLRGVFRLARLEGEKWRGEFGQN